LNCRSYNRLRDGKTIMNLLIGKYSIWLEIFLTYFNVLTWYSYTELQTAARIDSIPFEIVTTSASWSPKVGFTEATSNRRYAVDAAYRNSCITMWTVHTGTVAISLLKLSFSDRRYLSKETCLRYRPAIHIACRYGEGLFVVAYCIIQWTILCAS
jgi:hypothetical protein